MTLAIGGCTVAELKQRMTAQEFQDWKAFYLVEPFGNTREDHRAGIIAATLANTFKKKSAKRYTPADFFPDYAPRRQTWQEQLAIVEALNAAFGGRDLRKKAG